MRILIVLLLLGAGLVTHEGSDHRRTAEPPPRVAPPKPGSKWSELWQTAHPAEDAERLVLPRGAPPEKVGVIRLQAGAGKALRPGDGFVISYKSFDYRTGKLVEEHWSGPGFSWTYGIGETVKAFEPGMREMREGEWRELLAPSDWGHSGVPLVFLVQLRKVIEQ